MKSFRFRQFEIKQNDKVFRVGTDGVLLGTLADCADAKSILEIGSGTGLISLMVAQRNAQAYIQAIDINKAAAALTAENFACSPFSSRLTAVHADARSLGNSSFDLVLCNPPFFEDHGDETAKDYLARRQVTLSFRDLITTGARLVGDNGVLSVIVPYDSSGEFAEMASEQNLHLIRRVDIRGIAGGVWRRSVLEFARNKKTPVLQEFTVEKSPRIYSEEYLELTRDFHVFKA